MCGIPSMSASPLSQRLFLGARSIRRGVGCGTSAGPRVMKINSMLEDHDLLSLGLQDSPELEKKLYLLGVRLRPVAGMAVFRRGCSRGGLNVASRLALSASERALARPSRIRPSDLSRASASSSPGAALHVADRCRLARGGSHYAAARQSQGGKGVRAKARRLDCCAAEAAAGGGAFRGRGGSAAAR